MTMINNKVRAPDPLTRVFSFKTSIFQLYKPFGSYNTMANVVRIGAICSLPQGWGIHHV